MKKALSFIAQEVGMFTIFAVSTACIATAIQMKKGGNK